MKEREVSHSDFCRGNFRGDEIRPTAKAFDVVVMTGKMVPRY